MTETTTVTVENNETKVNIEVPKTDAKKIEQEMLQAAENRAIDPAESAAMVFHMYKPEVLKRLPLLSSKQMRRLLRKLIEYPLNEGELKGFSKLENEFFLLSDAMLQSKFIMMQQTYMESAEELVKAQDAMFKGEIKEEVEFGSSNEEVNEQLKGE
jgi:hypothetical protein